MDDPQTPRQDEALDRALDALEARAPGRGREPARGALRAAFVAVIGRRRAVPGRRAAVRARRRRPRIAAAARVRGRRDGRSPSATAGAARGGRAARLARSAPRRRRARCSGTRPRARLRPRRSRTRRARGGRARPPRSSSSAATCATSRPSRSTRPRARDFDDAVSAAPEGDGARLWIHIADVAAHVRPGAALDARGAARAATASTPRARSSRCCPRALSARGLQPRARASTGSRSPPRSSLDADGEPRSTALLPQPHPLRRAASTTTSSTDLRRRATPPAEIAEPLALARRAAARARERRPVGALEIESSEPEFEFDSDGHVVAAPRVAQTEAHRLIEQLMILTNERVAELCERRGVPTLYRVHEQPDPQRVAACSSSSRRSRSRPRRCPSSSSAARGRRARRARRAGWSPREAERRGHGRAAYTSLVLRSLKQAYLQRPKPRPRRPRQPRLRPLHLADPPLPRPDRPPGAAVDARRRRGRARPRPRSARPAGGARSASASRCASSATPTRSAPRSCSSASCSSAAGSASSRARSRA